MELEPTDPFKRYQALAALTPLPDVKELSPDSGWLLWDLAERLRDAQAASKTE